ncbi:MAG TPA: protein jag [Thermoanaerobacterales bacterium]|nr:protein jag [Thermoanaerobacterales bacterium]
MKSIRKKGKTVEQAVELALKELGVSREEVDVEVLDAGSKGIFSILAKDAMVMVTVKQDNADFVFRFLSQIINAMKVNVSIDVKEEGNHIFVNLQGPNVGLLIGRRGETLDALQYLTGLALNKRTDEYIRVIIDGAGYRVRRKNTLIRLAEKLAKQAKKTGKKITLEPMPPYERKIIHTALQNDPAVKTYSEGLEPYRRIVIEAKQ